MKYIFDTNVFRRASECDLVKAQLLEFKKSLGRSDRTYICELTLLELNSQLRRDKCFRYQQRKAGMLSARELTDGNILPLPDYFLRHLFKNGRIEDLGNYRLNWEIYWRHLEASKSITSFKRKSSISLNRAQKLERIAINSWSISEIRNEIERSYLQSMHLNVGWISRSAYSKHLEDKRHPLWHSVRELVRSPEFAWEIYRAIADRCGVPLIGEVQRTSHDVEVMNKLCAFMAGYKSVVLKTIEDNYNYAKNKNDYIDIHLLPYLADEEMKLVTQDGKLKAKIGACPDQVSRVLTIDELSGAVGQGQTR